MKLETELNQVDLALRAEAIEGFVPAQVSDIHAHVLEPSGYVPSTLAAHLQGRTISPESYRAAMELLLPGRLTGALFFPFPSRQHDRPAVNGWMYAEIAKQPKTFQAGGLAIVSPADDPRPTEEAMAAGVCRGLKPYHFYVGRADTSQVALEDFAPEWMWEQCDRHGAILMLHLMRDASVSDPVNRDSLLRLGKKYPNCQAVLAHVARSFNHRTVRGLSALAHLPNICVDTSAITESEGMRFALEVLGPGRVLYGSDYPISHLRGRCVTTGNQMLWVYAEENKAPEMTFIGIESLLSLREACRQVGLGAADVQRIFRDNAIALQARFHA